MEKTDTQAVPLDQIICTIQGEGRNIGIPSLLIRTKGCNLSCQFCDSKRTWSIKSSDFVLDTDNIGIFTKEVINAVHELDYKIKCIMLTGGEPSIYFDNIIYRKFVTNLAQELDLDYVEIETNAAYRQFEDTEEFFTSLLNSAVNKNIIFNISPKQKSDIELIKKNILWCCDKKNNFNGKIDFVIKVVNEPNIIHILENDLLPILSPMSDPNIYIMPLTPYKKDGLIDKGEYIQNCHKTIEYCLRMGFNYCPREHIWLFGTNTNEHAKIL